MTQLCKPLIKLRPLANRVIVEQHAATKKTKSGIVIANANDKPLRGTVIAVGPGHWLGDKFIETTVKPGDVVLFGKRVGEKVDLDLDTTVLVLHEHEILARLDA